MNNQFIVSSAIVMTVASPLAAQIAGFSDQSDGYSWRKASFENRMAYCSASAAAFSKRGTSIHPQKLFDAIQEFYTSEDSNILKKKLFDITAILAVAGGR